jgi:hypothetical protein
MPGDYIIRDDKGRVKYIKNKEMFEEEYELICVEKEIYQSHDQDL